jgi:putative CocE/NonD family hydrolase
MSVIGSRTRLVVCVLAAVFMVASWHASAGDVTQRFGVRMPMRDGVELSADIWLPAEEGRFPAILIRTPYLKTTARHRYPEYGHYFASRGYVFVVQDVRGRGDSDGEFDFFFGEGDDGYDTIEWIAAQPWSDGRVGMMMGSYSGTLQWLAARERPPHLVCIVPTAPAGRYFDEVPYTGGAFMLGFALPYLNDVSGRISQANNAAMVDWNELLRNRPLLTLDEAFGRKMPLYRKFLEHSILDAYWRRISFNAEDFQKIDLPALTVTGWFDGDQPGALFYWRGMAEHSPARERQFLLIGPWTHSQTYLGGELRINDMEFTGESVIDNKALHLAFFDRYLAQRSEAFDHPRAKVWITGSNRWLELDHYPPAEVEARRLYLHSGGRANTLVGDGSLDWEPPGNEPPDRYIYNPENPVPSDIGDENLAIDHRALERRDDVLVYSTEPLDEELEILGTVFLVLHAASDARDTDFVTHILDVYPDGRAVKLGPREAAVIRARYRNGYKTTELLTPGEPTTFRVELNDIGHTFLPGHRVRIEVTSSASPFINPNQNTGNPVATDTEWTIAHQTVFHDAVRPSHVVLPVMPDGAPDDTD